MPRQQDEPTVVHHIEVRAYEDEPGETDPQALFCHIAHFDRAELARYARDIVMREWEGTPDEASLSDYLPNLLASCEDPAVQDQWFEALLMTAGEYWEAAFRRDYTTAGGDPMLINNFEAHR